MRAPTSRLPAVTADQARTNAPTATVSAEPVTGAVKRINVDDEGRAPKRARAPRRSSTTVTRRDVWGRRQRFEARKVRRLIRQVDPWSVLKLSLIFFLCVWVMFMVAAIIVWQVARTSGSIDRIEGAISDLGLPPTKFDGRFIFRQFGLVGIVLALAGTAAATVSSVVFNLISDIIGGVWITVIEEETARPIADDER